MRHKIRKLTRKEMMIAGGICLLLLLVTVNYILGGSKSKKASVAHGKPVVQVKTIVTADMMRHIDLSGQTVADANITLAPKYAGKITAVYVNLGDEVKKGQVLMEQDGEDMEISIRQNAAATKAAEADALESEATYDANYIMRKNTYDIVKSKYERNLYLFEIGAISQDTLDTIEKEYMSAKAALEILENQAASGSAASVESKRYTAEKQAHATDALRKQREDLILRAPRDGVIGFRNAEVGEMVSAGTKVLSLVDTHAVYVDCSLAEKDAAIIQAGQRLSVNIESLGQDFMGKIVYVSPAMEEATKTYTVRILLDELDTQIKAGLFARGQVDILQKKQTLSVPKEAVFDRNGHSAVFILKEDGTVEERQVRIGLMNDAEEEIVSGISSGEKVLLSNQDKLQDGDHVEVQEV